MKNKLQILLNKGVTQDEAIDFLRSVLEYAGIGDTAINGIFRKLASNQELDAKMMATIKYLDSYYGVNQYVIVGSAGLVMQGVNIGHPIGDIDIVTFVDTYSDIHAPGRTQSSSSQFFMNGRKVKCYGIEIEGCYKVDVFYNDSDMHTKCMRVQGSPVLVMDSNEIIMYKQMYFDMLKEQGGGICNDSKHSRDLDILNDSHEDDLPY